MPTSASASARAEAGPPRFVAWYEPRHDVLPQVAQHFVSRMGKVSWMIATPDASVLWDGHTLHNTGPLVRSAGRTRGHRRSPVADLLPQHLQPGPPERRA